MNISKLFVNEKDIIRKGIECLTEENCEAAFVDYFYNGGKNTTEFESKYVKALNYNIRALAQRIVVYSYKDCAREKLLSELVEVLMDAPYSVESILDNDELDYFFESYLIPKEEKLKFIKEYMLEMLENL